MHLTREQTHFGWDNGLPPVLTVGSGESVELELVEASGGQLHRDASAGALTALDFTRLNPVTGPIRVEGAMPGDVLEITIDSLDVAGWGWSAAIPGFGLLADQFSEPYLAVSAIEGGTVRLPFGVSVPVAPMVGTIGVAVPEAGVHSVVPPRRWGGNLDIRHLTAGAQLRLPVGVEGALFSIGDAHAAMGDGEVCGTGVETDAVVQVSFAVVKDVPLGFPRYRTAALSDRHGPSIATTGVAPDLMQASRDAVSGMIEEIVARTGIAAVEAYVLCSLAGDLKISEIVDAPNWVVSMHLAADVLEG